MTDPRGPGSGALHSNETINGPFVIGAENRSPLTAVRVGAGASGAANASSRSTNRIGDAEAGHREPGPAHNAGDDR
ncbi:hypothetical protein ACFRI7_09470 [Streptomyces sp. NPDC056716]|uniref:hypothetical protein n=1 Tax=unclassified Streptomyces TaxID=2593676 RepID=UPI00369AF296